MSERIRYSEEFNREAVAQVTERGHSANFGDGFAFACHDLSVVI